MRWGSEIRDVSCLHYSNSLDGPFYFFTVIGTVSRDTLGATASKGQELDGPFLGMMLNGLFLGTEVTP